MFDQRDARRRMAADERDHGRRAAYDQWATGPDRFGGPGGPGGGPRGRGRGRGPFGGGRGGFGGGGFGGPRGRARRGDVRTAILALLAERPMHGYEMIQELGERTGGAWNPSPGSVYPTLTMLEEEGLVTGEEVEGKRRFVLTEAGREADTAREGAPPWEQVLSDASPETNDLREALATTMPAVKQVFRAGSPAQQAKAAEILNETRRRLYEILAAEA